MKETLGALVALVVILFGVRYAYDRVMSGAASDTSLCLILDESATTVENNKTYITGTIRNDCGRWFTTVSIRFKLYGDNTFGQPTAVGYARNLDPHGTAPFKTQGIIRYEGHKLDEIKGF
jgi:hypothetical protein